MTLANIFHTGGLTLGLTLFTILVVGILWYQAFKASRSGGAQQDLKRGTQYDNKNIPVYKQAKFLMGLGVIVLYIIAMIIVASDYKGV